MSICRCCEPSRAHPSDPMACWAEMHAQSLAILLQSSPDGRVSRCFLAGSDSALRRLISLVFSALVPNIGRYKSPDVCYLIAEDIPFSCPSGLTSCYRYMIPSVDFCPALHSVQCSSDVCPAAGGWDLAQAEGRRLELCGFREYYCLKRWETSNLQERDQTTV